MEGSSESKGIRSSSMKSHVAAAGASSSSRPKKLMSVSESIEASKVHWSELAKAKSTTSEDSRSHYSEQGNFFFKFKESIGDFISMVKEKYAEKFVESYRIEAENKEVFKTLQSHPEWGQFFVSYDYAAFMSSWKLGLVIAEGAQGEILEVTWKGANGRRTTKILKVFKKGSLLKDLQRQWPHGFLECFGKAADRRARFSYNGYVANVHEGMLLPNGYFAFVMPKEDGDLRTLIDRLRDEKGHGYSPFEKKKMEKFLYQIASGVDFLHKRNIVHRDLKASNVLVTDGTCYVADFECSVGVIGTGFWRDPQILQACKEGNTSQKPELFTRAADVYSYGMTCYEILTGKIPFEGESENRPSVIRELFIEGQRPELPEDVDDWIRKLVCSCWQRDQDERPTFEEILNTIVANTISPYIKAVHDFDMKVNNKEIKLLLGCNKVSHDLELLEHAPYESGDYTCNLCLKQGNGADYHCSSCGDFDLHVECATIQPTTKSSMHPHLLLLIPPRLRLKGEELMCNACLCEGKYSNLYVCSEEGCDFHLHIHCAKYARRIFICFHEEHELELTYTSKITREGEPSPICNRCIIQLDPLEIIYSCGDCGFHVHPHCIIGKLECKTW